MTPDRSGGGADQQGRAIQVEPLRVQPAWTGGPASRGGFVSVAPATGEAPAEIDWSLLALLVAGDGHAPIVILGDDRRALASALASAGTPIVLLGRQLEGISHLASPQGSVKASPVCSRIIGGLPFRDGSMGLVIVNQAMDRPNGHSAGEPVSIHPGLLAEVRRVLRPGGILCLILSQRRHRLRLATLRAWLEQCGFCGSDFYLASPGHRRFTALFPVACRRAMRACIDLAVQGNTSRERWLRGWLKSLATLGLLGTRAAEYVVLGRKGR